MKQLSRTLKVDCIGDDVVWLQTSLKDLGYYKGAIDRRFGQGLLYAVLDFQKEHGLLPDGLFGNKSFLVLKDVLDKYNQIKIDKSMIWTDNLLNDDQYYKQETKKSAIWLHHTAGGSRPDWTIHGWNSDALGRVATSYVIGRSSSSSNDTSWDGKILRAFDDKYWAHHLGLKHNNELLNKGSVGIEICNYGYLTKGNDGRFYNYVNKPVNDKDVVELNEPFRGYKYYERYTDAQLEATRKLIIDISNRHNIPIAKGIYNPEWFEYDNKWFSLGGLRTHTQVRQDKYDCFPQKELIQMLNSL